MDEIMNNQELHEYGINLISSYLKEEGYTIIELNTELNTDPQIIAQKLSDMIFVVVRTVMYPKKEKDIKFSKAQLKIIKDGSVAYGAKCYIAKVGLANPNAENAKELGVPYKDTDLLIKFNGFIEI